RGRCRSLRGVRRHDELAIPERQAQVRGSEGDRPSRQRSNAGTQAVGRMNRDLERIWNRIETWLEAHAPSLASQFGPPAKAREIAATERFLGVKFPDDIRESYLRHNGHVSLMEGDKWLSLEEIQRSWSLWKSLLERGSFEGKENDEKGSYVRRDW